MNNASCCIRTTARPDDIRRHPRQYRKKNVVNHVCIQSRNPGRLHVRVSGTTICSPIGPSFIDDKPYLNCPPSYVPPPILSPLQRLSCGPCPRVRHPCFISRLSPNPLLLLESSAHRTYFRCHLCDAVCGMQGVALRLIGGRIHVRCSARPASNGVSCVAS